MKLKTLNMVSMKTGSMPAFEAFLNFGIENYYASKEGQAAYFDALLLFCQTYTKDGKTPRHPLYEGAVSKANELKLHLRNDQSIGGKIKEKRPTEHIESTEYREKAFEPITYSHSQKWIGFLNRVFHKSVHNVSYQDVQSGLIREGEGIKDYINELPKFGDLIEYGREYHIQALAADPSGWHGVYSKKGVSLLMENELPEPVPAHIPSSAVIYYRETEFLFVLSNETSELEASDGRQNKSGKIFWVFDLFRTYKVVQYGRPEDLSFDFILWDNHYFGQIPFQQNGGRIVVDEDFFLTPSPFFEVDSIFSPAIPYLNKALNLSSDLDVNLVLHAFLQKIEYSRECTDCEATGFLAAPGQPDNMMICPSCNGSRVKKNSLFDAYTINTEKMGGVITGDVPTVAKYVDLPLEIIEVLAKRENYYFEQAYKMLGLDFLINPTTIQAQTAESKRLDKDGAMIFLEMVSSLLYGSIQFMADWINILRYGAVIPERLDENRVIFSKPVRFDIDSAKDLFENLELLKDSGAYELLAGEYIKKIARAEFGDDSPEYHFIKATVELDPLFGKDEGVIFAGRQAGDFEENDIELHFNIKKYVTLALEREPLFFDMAINEQKEIMTLVL